MRNKTYDLIIAGLGAAGLTLVRKLLGNPVLSNWSILVVDAHLEPFSDKTWCFWDRMDSDLTPYSDHIWNILDVQAGGARFTETLQGLRYHCVRSDTYSKIVYERMAKHSSIEMVKADILGFDYDAGKDCAELRTDKGTFAARWILQSALRPPSEFSDPDEIRLIQHFEGWEIQTETPFFDPERAMLMDFETPQANGVTFFYILPFTQNKALIEYTIFSEEMLTDGQYEKGVSDYLSRLGLPDGRYTVTRRERGGIPMDSTRYPGWWNPRVMNIGTIAGHTKPSTGYTFMRIQAQCDRIVRDLEHGLRPSHSGRSSFRFRVYDLMLLHILQQDPATALRIFHDLFKRNSISRVLRFLDEKTHVGQELAIFSTLPYIPFFKAIGARYSRILKGA